MVRIFIFSASLLLLAGPASATPSDDPSQLEQHQAFQAVMDEAMAEFMRPGPKQEGWDKGGVDIYRILDSDPGGRRQNYLLSIDKDGDRDITVVDADASGTYVPKSWTLVLREGQAQRQGAANLTLGNLDGTFYIVGWDKERRHGDAFCSAGGLGGELYEASGEAAPPEIPRSMIPAVFSATVTRLKDASMCWRFDRHGDGFRVTYFLEDGSTLPTLNSFEERVTIVPASVIEELLKKEKP
jgi:hypothetical protein